MRAEIIVTGSELLSGGGTDTNSPFLADALLLLGLETAFVTTVGDVEKNMEDVLRTAMGRAEVVIVTGGLGPTEDDITRKAIAKVLKKRLVLHEDALAAIKARLAGWGAPYASSGDRQALMPAGARLLPNPVGVAPGFFLEEEDKIIAALPGVPEEMQAMYREGLKPVLEGRFSGGVAARRRVLRTNSLSESKVNEIISTVLKQENPAVGLTAHAKGVDVRIIARDMSAEGAQALVDKAEAAARERLGDAVYGVDGQELEEVTGALLKQRRLTLAVAESCTGGLISSRITNIAGSSEYFERGAVVYSNEAKTGMLGVPEELIERHGAVSREVAAAMAKGVREKAGTHLGLAVTGIAGPGGGTKEKPVGLVYVALASDRDVKVQEYRLPGSREHVRTRASQMALDMVRRHLIG